jgi:hypothetical protein
LAFHPGGEGMVAMVPFFYGPEQALFDKTWKPPDIEKV